VNGEVPLSLSITSGAGETQADLTHLKVSELRLQTGASSSEIQLPAGAGHTRVNIEAGAASVSLTVPPGVAARIRNRSGLSSLKIDTGRFPRQGEVYQTPDYESAVNQVEVDIKTGVGSVEVR
jgi:hypothetical protein